MEQRPDDFPSGVASRRPDVGFESGDAAERCGDRQPGCAVGVTVAAFTADEMTVLRGTATHAYQLYRPPAELQAAADALLARGLVQPADGWPGVIVPTREGFAAYSVNGNGSRPTGAALAS